MQPASARGWADIPDLILDQPHLPAVIGTSSFLLDHWQCLRFRQVPIDCDSVTHPRHRLTQGASFLQQPQPLSTTLAAVDPPAHLTQSLSSSSFSELEARLGAKQLHSRIAAIFSIDRCRVSCMVVPASVPAHPGLFGTRPHSGLSQGTGKSKYDSVL
jgi:hypothetical protein